MMPNIEPTRVLLRTETSGQVVVVPDPDSGRNLLIGTLKSGGSGVPITVHVPEFEIRPSWQGLVVEPVSDRVTLRVVPEGFAIVTGDNFAAMPESGRSLINAAKFTRRFDLPADPAAEVFRRLQAEVQQASEAPAQARLEARKAAAQTMLALGMGPEAQSLLRLAVVEDPRAAADPEVNGLTGIAAVLSFRPQDAGGLDDTGLDGSDEIALWRALRLAMTNGSSPEAAQVLSTTAGLVLAYPAALRNRLLPLIAETMVSGGAGAAADGLLASLPDEPVVKFARAARLEQKGDAPAALKIYDELAGSRDRYDSSRAEVRAALLRLSTAAISPATAAGVLEHDLISWRGDGIDRDLQLKTAQVMAQAGEWRKAFALLKETAQAFPEASAEASSRMRAMLGDLLNGPAGSAIKPLDLVTLAEENAGLIADDDSSGMSLLLADRLVALDLPHRAEPVLMRMITAKKPGTERATLGLRLAALHLSEQDADGALAALSVTEVPDLPTSLHDDRLMVEARARILKRDRVGALASLSASSSAGADELRATILGQDGDWRAVAVALDRAAQTELPSEGPLTPAQQDFVLRLASAQSQSGNRSALQDLSVRQASRMVGDRANLFRLLTSAPVNQPADLQRVSGEIAIAKAIPSSLASIGTR